MSNTASNPCRRGSEHKQCAFISDLRPVFSTKSGEKKQPNESNKKTNSHYLSNDPCKKALRFFYQRLRPVSCKKLIEYKQPNESIRKTM